MRIMMINTNDKGLTIIELLIATVILAFMIGSMTIALMQQQRQFNLIKEASDIDQTGRVIIEFIASEIKNASSRQGKSFSLSFVNGGGETCTQNTDDAGTADSPPDCITIYTWDITKGMEIDPTTGTTEMPSIAETVEIFSTEGALVLTLPESWIDESGILIGETEPNQEVLIGVRSRTTLCNPNPEIDCINNPEFCEECAVIMEGSVNESNRTITFDNIDDIIETNFPVEFSSISEFINGKTDANGNQYGFISNISSQVSEMTIVQSRAFRVNPEQRELEMSINGGNFQPVAGGSTSETPERLDSPGIVDLQLVFNLQNPDGSITKVGYCDSTTCNCHSSFDPSNPPPSERDFSCGAVLGRENSIRSVEIYLVVKSKIKPKSMGGDFYRETIPRIGDVLERTVDSPSAFLEPEEGFIYRIHSVTVYPRNITREDFG